MPYPSDSITTILGVLLVVAFVILGSINIIVLSVILYRRQTRKSIRYKVLALEPVLTRKDIQERKVTLLYEQERVDNLTLAVVKIVNDGKVPVPASDYERPISVSAGEGAQFLSAEVLGTNPPTLTPTVWVTQKQQRCVVELTPLLLNAGDSVTVKCLLSGVQRNVEVDARITGVNGVMRITSGNEQAAARFLVVMFVLGMTVAIAYLAITFLARVPLTGPVESSILLAWALSAAFILIISLAGLQTIRGLRQ
jgi:hypothetical protein